MTNRHPALMLAEQCDLEDTFERMCAAELTSLHAENEQLRAELEAIGAGGVGPLIAAPQPRQPLTEKQIDEILVEAARVPAVPVYKSLARAVERAHHIQEGA